MACTDCSTTGVIGAPNGSNRRRITVDAVEDEGPPAVGTHSTSAWPIYDGNAVVVDLVIEGCTLPDNFQIDAHLEVSNDLQTWVGVGSPLEAIGFGYWSAVFSGSTTRFGRLRLVLTAEITASCVLSASLSTANL